MHETTASASRPRRHRRFVASARTSLPTWPDAPPPLDEAGRGFVLVGTGRGAAAVLDGWRARAGDRPVLAFRDENTEESGDRAAVWLEPALASARTGWRLMIAAPAADVLRLSALARRAGMIEAEIRAFAVQDGVSPLVCVHCRTDFEAEGEPGDEVDCPGCGLRLVVHQHLSRRLGRLAAFVADAEGGRP